MMIDVGQLTSILMIIVVCLFSFKSGYDIGKERMTNSYTKELKRWVEQLKEVTREEK